MPLAPISPDAPALIADIGGTNARFALLTEPGGAPHAMRTLACADHTDIAAAIEAYLGGTATPRPARAVIAIANPVTGDRVRMTNHHWCFSIEATRRRLGLERLRVLNDFTALALALAHLGPAERLQVGGGVALARAPMALIGPGTGLGVSGLLPAGERGWVALAGEGGHVNFSPADDFEIEILRHARRRFAHVSAERLISGSLGLPNLYLAVAELAGAVPEDLAPAEITARALAGRCPHCARALEVFCAMLGTAAADLALTLGAQGGVYIGGGIVPRFPEFFARSGFRARFEDKGRLGDYLRAIPTFVITAANPALLGAAAVAAELE